MKYSLVLLINIVSLISLHSQPDSVIVHFVEADPLWEHAVVDPNYYLASTDTTITAYNSFFPVKLLRLENDLFFYNRAQAAPSGDSYGFILEKININSGEVLWQEFNTFYNNDTTQEKYMKLTLNREENKLLMLGLKRAGEVPDKINWLNRWDYGASKSFFKHREYDLENGDLKKQIIGVDSISYPWVFLFPVDDFAIKKWLWIKPDGILPYDENEFVFGFKFYRLDEDLNVQYPPFDTLMHKDTGKEPSPWIDGLFPIYEIGKDTFAVVVLSDMKNKDNYSVQLIWMALNEEGHIDLVRRENIQDYLPHTYYPPVFVRFLFKNEQLIFMHSYEGAGLPNKTNYIVWMNKYGDIKQVMTEPWVGDHLYHSLELAHASEDALLFVAFPTKNTTGRGMDFIRWKKNEDQVEWIGSLTTDDPDKYFYKNFRLHELYDDGKLIIAAETVLEKEGADDRYVKYYCFDVKDLGIDISNPVFTTQIPKIKVFPNPADQCIQWEAERALTGSLELRDMLGKKWASTELNKATQCKLAIAQVPVGMYALIFKGKEGEYISEKLIVER